MIKKFTLSLAGFILVATSLFAQEVKIYPNAENITTDDQLVLNVEVRNVRRVSQPRFPELAGFRSYGTSTSQSYGPSGAVVTFSRSYIPMKAGQFKIPSFAYQAGGKVFKSDEFIITVKKGTGQPKAKRRSNNPFDDFFKNPFDDFFGGNRRGTKPKEYTYKESEADYFLSINLNKDTCYIGEQVLGEVILYINERDQGKINVDGEAIGQMQQNIKNSGFWQEIIEFQRIPVNRVEIGGKRYLAYTLYRTVLFPIQDGTIPFKDITLDAKKLYVATNASPFDRFLGNQTSKFEPIKIRAANKSLHVKSLPPTDLPNSNMVGRFSLSPSINTQSLNTGEPLELKVSVKGTGNIYFMKPPQTNFPSVFKIEGEPLVEFKTSKDQKAMFGEKEFTWYLVPTRSGEYDLGAVQFYYFDPKKEVYDSLVVKGIKVSVTGEDLDNLVLKSSSLDNFYQSQLNAGHDSFHSNNKPGPFLLVLIAIGVLGGVGAIGFTRNRKRQKSEPDQKDESGKDWWSS